MTVHRGTLAARPDVACVLHTHTVAKSAGLASALPQKPLVANAGFPVSQPAGTHYGGNGWLRKSGTIPKGSPGLGKIPLMPAVSILVIIIIPDLTSPPALHICRRRRILRLL